MKKLLLPMVLTLMMVVGCSKKSTTPGYVQFFQGEFKAALEKAQAENKMLMINFYTDW